MTSTPVEFLAIGLDSGKFFQKRNNEYAGPCPFCGGGKDRFVIFTNRPFPHWNWFCRKCWRKGWADQLNPRLKAELTPEMRAEYAKRNQESEIARKKAQTMLLERYQKSRVWEKYHTAMNATNRAWWRSHGIPDEWQDFWQLGYVPHLVVGSGESAVARNAYTIPKFDFGWRPTNMDYRIVDPPEKVGKYRPIKGLPATPFISMPEGRTDRIAIVEGAKKAMVLHARNIMPDYTCIFGIPGDTSWCGLETKARKYRRVWIMLDPGAEKFAHRLATAIGKHAIVVELPDKPDDMVLAGATRETFLALMRKAEKK